MAKKKTTKTPGIEILDENPKEVTYNNPPGWRFVLAKVTDEKGETKEGIYLLSNDNIERLKS